MARPRKPKLPEREAPVSATTGPLHPSADLPPPAPSKKTVGSPRQYDDAYFEDLSEKLILWVTMKWAQFKRTGMGEIWLGDFAFENTISRHTLYMLADADGRHAPQNAKFAETYQWAKTAQESWAIFDEKVNHGIRRILLSQFHDIKEKQETALPPGQGPLSVVFVNQFNHYLQQMGVAPIAIEGAADADPKQLTEYGKDFQEFEEE